MWTNNLCWENVIIWATLRRLYSAEGGTVDKGTGRKDKARQRQQRGRNLYKGSETRNVERNNATDTDGECRGEVAQWIRRVSVAWRGGNAGGTGGGGGKIRGGGGGGGG